MAADKSDAEHVEMNSSEFKTPESPIGHRNQRKEYRCDCENRKHGTKRQFSHGHGSTCSTSDMSEESDLTSGASTSASTYEYESEGSNGDRVFESVIGEKQTPQFKAAFKKEDIVALQRTELIDGKPQDPIFVINAAKEDLEISYAPGKLPDDFKNGALWKSLVVILEDLLCLKKQPLEGSWYYVQDGGEEAGADKSEFVLKYLKKKYGSSAFPRFWFPLVKDIMEGFLTYPPFSNTVGRQATYCLLYLCWEIVHELDSDKWAEIGVRNVGGGALGYRGSFTYAKFDVPAGCKNATKYLAEECMVSTACSYTTAVPDGQVFSSKENHICEKKNFFLTVEVKPGKKRVNDHERVKPPRKNKHGKKRKMKIRTKDDKPLKAETDAGTQAWRQALVGLANSDTSYGLLITPSYARIYQLCIGRNFPGIGDPCPEGKYKSLVTSTKIIAFHPVAQNVQELIEAIVCIMLKTE